MKAEVAYKSCLWYHNVQKIRQSFAICSSCSTSASFEKLVSNVLMCSVIFSPHEWRLKLVEVYGLWRRIGLQNSSRSETPKIRSLTNIYGMIDIHARAKESVLSGNDYCDSPLSRLRTKIYDMNITNLCGGLNYFWLLTSNTISVESWVEKKNRLKRNADEFMKNWNSVHAINDRNHKRKYFDRIKVNPVAFMQTLLIALPTIAQKP